MGTDTDNAAWFQFGGNTYVVQSGLDHVTTTTPDFVDGTDSIIKISGLVDLSTASYNQDVGTLEIA
jgi:S-layer protein